MKRAPSGAVRGGAQLRDRVTAAIGAAVIEELAERGYGAFSMNAVAERAGVGKAALYRRWPSKLPMVVDIVASVAVSAAEPQDTGTLSGDLWAVLRDIRDAMAQPYVAPIVTDLVAASLRSPELAEALRREVSVPRRRHVRQLIDRAVARGEISPDVDADVVLDLLAGPHVIRFATSGGAMDDGALEALHGLLLRALTA